MSSKGFCWSWIRHAHILIIVMVLNVMPCESVDYRASRKRQSPVHSPATLATGKFHVNPYKHLFDICADFGYKWGALYWNEHTKSCCKPIFNCGPRDDSRIEDFGIVFCTRNRTRDRCDACQENFIQPHLVHSIITPASSAVCFKKPPSPECPQDEATSTAGRSSVSSCPIKCECNLDSCWYGVDPCRCQEPKQYRCPRDHRVNRISGDCVQCPWYGYKDIESCGPCKVNTTLISMGPSIPVKTTVPHVPKTTRPPHTTSGSSSGKSFSHPTDEPDVQKTEDPQEQINSITLVIGISIGCVMLIVIISVLIVCTKKRCKRSQPDYSHVPSCATSRSGIPVPEEQPNQIFQNVITASGSGSNVQVCQVRNGTQNVFANNGAKVRSTAVSDFLHHGNESRSGMVPVQNGYVVRSPLPSAPPQQPEGVGHCEPNRDVKELQHIDQGDTFALLPHVPYGTVPSTSRSVPSLSGHVMHRTNCEKPVKGEQTQPEDACESSELSTCSPDISADIERCCLHHPISQF